MVISLFAETQKHVILSGQEKVDIMAFEATFKENFNNMVPFLNLELDDKPIKRKLSPSYQSPENIEILIDDLFVRTVKLSNKNIKAALTMLKEEVNIEFVNL
jgi:hypothetical protein